MMSEKESCNLKGGSVKILMLIKGKTELYWEEKKLDLYAGNSVVIPAAKSCKIIASERTEMHIAEVPV